MYVYRVITEESGMDVGGQGGRQDSGKDPYIGNAITRYIGSMIKYPCE